MKIYEKIFKFIYNIELENAKNDILDDLKNSIKELRLLYQSNNPNFVYTQKLRNAYLFCYYVNYTYIVDKIIKEKLSKELNNILTKEIGICCYAAGPAPELYAFINLFANLNGLKFNAYSLDINSDWEEQRSITFELIKNKHPDIIINNVNIRSNLKQSLDSCDGYYREINSKCKVYFMNNCINHLSLNDVGSIIFRMKNIKKGSVFIIIDLNYDIVRKILNIIVNDKYLNDVGVFISSHIIGEPDCTYLENNKPSDLVIEKIFNKENLLHAKYKSQYYHVIYKKTKN